MHLSQESIAFLSTLLYYPPAWVIFVLLTWAVAHVIGSSLKIARGRDKKTSTRIFVLEVIAVSVLLVVTLHSYFESSIATIGKDHANTVGSLQFLILFVVSTFASIILFLIASIYIKD